MFVKQYLTFILCSSLFTLGFVATSATARDLSFAWAANQEQIDGYKLYYDTDTTGAPYEGTGAREGNSPVTISGQQHTLVTLHGLSDTATYHFTLTAFKGSDQSAYTTEITVPPKSSNHGEVTAHFAWAPNSESNLNGYKIHYGTAHGTYTNVIDVGNPAAAGDKEIHGNVGNLVEGTTYYFVCTAYDSQGNESDYSQEIKWTATGKSSTDSSAAATNSPSGSQDGAGTGTTSGTDSSATATTTPSGSKDGAGTGTNSGVSTGNTSSADTNPVAVITPTNTSKDSVQFQWMANKEQVDGYRIYYKTGSQGGPEYNGTGANEGDSPIDVGDVTSFSLSGLKADKWYYFTLTAYLGAEESAHSKEIVLWTGDTPAAPVIMKIKVK